MMGALALSLLYAESTACFLLPHALPSVAVLRPADCFAAVPGTCPTVPAPDRPRHHRARLTVSTESATLQRTWDPYPVPPTPVPSTPALPVTRRPPRKLDHRRLGPFEVIVDPRLRTPYAVRLRFSETMHVPQLEHAADDPFLGQRQPSPLPVEVDGELEYHVDQILDPRLFGR